MAWFPPIAHNMNSLESAPVREQTNAVSSSVEDPPAPPDDGVRFAVAIVGGVAALVIFVAAVADWMARNG